MDERRKDIILTLIVDFVMTGLAWFLYFYMRFEWNVFGQESVSRPASLWIPAASISGYWVIFFAVFGLYRQIYLQSRMDEVIKVLKISILGTLVLFFVLFLDALGWSAENLTTVKAKTLLYWALVAGLVIFGRIVVRTIQKVNVRRGTSYSKALIVGTGSTAVQVFEDLERNELYGLKVVGFLGRSSKIDLPQPYMGGIGNLRMEIERHQVSDVIIALDDADQNKLVTILEQCDIPDLRVKILPDFHQLISGLNKTNQIFGLPLIEVMPDPMPMWEKVVKRLLDIAVSLVLLIGLLPLWLIVGILIRLSSKGPAIYSQQRVGRNSRLFTMHKFRTMYQDAELKTGPVWASDDDPRITPLGYWLRKLRIDEIPQFWNVLKGEMSLVGPRPERPHFVDQFKQQIPLYTRRLRVKPGITGWAQVKWKYDSSLDDVREKTKYDLFYLENMSLKMDLKILFNTIFTVVGGKGK